MKKLLVEFLGTFFLVLTVIMTKNPFAAGAMLMAWIHIGAYISGAHYNPLLSFAFALRKKLDWSMALRYMGAQTVGSFAAFFVRNFIYGSFTVPTINPDHTIAHAFGVEVLLAFTFALVVLTLVLSDYYKNNHIFGFAIGFTLPALAYIGGPVSGGLFNPAIALGAHILAVIKDVPVELSHTALYVVAAFVGAAVASYAFDFIGLSGKRA